MFFALFPEEETLDYIAHRSLIRVNTVLVLLLEQYPVYIEFAIGL